MRDERLVMGGHYAAEVSDPGVYRRRRDQVRAQIGESGVAVVHAASDHRSYGDVGTFRQDAGFFYLTGVELPNSVLMIETDGDTLFLPARRPSLEAWTGPRFGPGEETARLLGFDRVLDRDATETVIDARRRGQPSWSDRLASGLASGKVLWAPLPAPSPNGSLSPVQELIRNLRDRLPSFQVRDLTPLLSDLRLVKDETELGLLERAVSATIAAMAAAARAVRPGAREGELEGAAFAALRASGAEGWSFPPIVGSGIAGCTLHYDANAGTLADGELVVVDIGARYGYYCGDLTRTFPVNGRFSSRQRGLYEAVLGAYWAAVEGLKPGASIAEIRRAAFEALEGNALQGDDDRSLGQFFIHGIGHFLGLEPHDAGGESPVLKPGMVLTIEPGVYLPGEGIGIRIEDDFVITETGCRCLSEGLPRDPIDVESFVAGTPS